MYVCRLVERRALSILYMDQTRTARLAEAYARCAPWGPRRELSHIIILVLTIR